MVRLSPTPQEWADDSYTRRLGLRQAIDIAQL